ncbi:MAG: helix-turn-helix domain-containing protein [Firmicutes bacterium]|nr:helix-turn-helix domain-containing protein [Bacillota bacterium]
MRFGERLRNLREDNDETQREIGDLIFVSHKMISDYERGIHFPRDERVIITLAEHFGVSIDYLFGVSDMQNSEKENELIKKYNTLTPDQKNEVLDFINFLIYKNEKKEDN